MLLEGAVGVGKTELAKAIAAHLGRGLDRVDGDGRYTESRLVGLFDPPMVLERGYQPDTFLAGPLVRAMRSGGVLVLNELNRMPEGVQNVLLPALDEGVIQVPTWARSRQPRASRWSPPRTPASSSRPAICPRPCSTASS
ncbi:MAG: AAA domain-containing protein [Proteobacteria bacterium]|nr:AAA domain-containing protein [Pseudomonadota bacterium]MCP4920385.1 AAA domain-containing protein [Pseudomonadota bacterium]